MHSRFFEDLPHALNGARHEIDDPAAGRISYYTAGPDDESGTGAPLLLIHSVNAAASAHEVRPLFDAYRARRPVYALDLPGYGFSERSDRPYLPRLMVDAIHAMIAQIQAGHPGRPIDALAVSLSCEFLARAGHERPESFRSLALVSATGLRKNTPEHGSPEGNRGSPLAYRILNAPVLGRTLFRLLTTPPSVRFFLRKTWGRKEIDEPMFRQSCRTARQAGARHAPFHFLSGYLFSADILSVYQRLRQPTWLTHGVRGDFTDYSRSRLFEAKSNWRIDVFETGALPYFEMPEAFVEAYEDFLDDVSAGRVINRQGSSD